MKKLALIFLLMTFQRVSGQSVNTVSIPMVSLPAGGFYMGSERDGEDADESPVHRVIISKPFQMGATEVTNAQYERFDPAHRALRGKGGFSKADDEAVIFVSYAEAVAFCNWLTKQEGKPYRLPTEAEWEYACRAKTVTDFSTGSNLPDAYRKSQKTDRDAVVVPLTVAQSPANAFGLYDLHGNVEEWCADWYGSYLAGEQTDPIGRASGLYRVTRGGSHGTPVRYLRSANRSGMIPEDKSWLVGFRVVQADPLPTPTLRPEPASAVMQNVTQRAAVWKGISANQPVFMEPIRYVNKPSCESGVPFYAHNHCPALTWCPNGDLLATWFSTNEESGREMTILASRLRAGQSIWDEPSVFCKVPDRNMTGTSLLHDGKGTIYHLNGVETDGDWQNLAIMVRESRDNGATWSAPQLANPEHTKRNQVGVGLFQTREGWLVQPCDADPGPTGGTAIHISKDRGKTWFNPSSNAQTPAFRNGATGGLIAGIHAGVTQLKDGSLLAFGRKDDLPGPDRVGLRMPMSISRDMGQSWTYQASEFPPVWSGQRPVLYRLSEGALLLISFTHHPDDPDGRKQGMEFMDAAGKPYKGYGLYATLSFDEGKTWPVRKLLTDGQPRYRNGGAWTGAFEMDATHAEPKGYMAITQTPDQLIHLVSSSQHYRFNLAWLKDAPTR